MDIFEYLPQLIVAYDGHDEFANLIHVKKAKQDAEYYCPCCGGIMYTIIYFLIAKTALSFDFMQNFMQKCV